MTLKPCTTCEKSGEVFVGHTLRTWSDEGHEVYLPCPVCEASGWVLPDVECLTEAEVAEELFETAVEGAWA